MKLSERLNHMKQHLLDEGDNYGAEVLHHAKERIDNLKEENEALRKAFDYICDDDSLEEVLADRKERMDALAAIRDNASLR